MSEEQPATAPPDRTVRIGKRTFTILFPELLRPLGVHNDRIAHPYHPD